MIKEAFVSFEVAKLLKEKGFVESCYGRYSVRSKDFHLDTTKPCNNGSNFLYCAPTHQMAMKWLRGKGIECVVIPIWNTIGKQYRSYVLSDLGDKYKDNYDSYSDNISYEGAVEEALKYCLENLI